MDRGAVTVIASDAHGSRQRTPYMLDAYEELENYYSKEMLHRVFYENPARICQNKLVF